MLAVHYAPRTPLTLITGDRAQERLINAITSTVSRGRRVGVLGLAEDLALFPDGTVTVEVGTWTDPASSAQRLFDALRSLDHANLDVLFARDLADPDTGLGRALADRLRRAARRVLDNHD
jgi:hypothetical protein